MSGFFFEGRRRPPYDLGCGASAAKRNMRWTAPALQPLSFHVRRQGYASRVSNHYIERQGLAGAEKLGSRRSPDRLRPAAAITRQASSGRRCTKRSLIYIAALVCMFSRQCVAAL